MKKLLGSLFVSCLFAASVYAAGPSETKIYRSTHTGTAELGRTVFSGSGRMFKIHITSAGVASGLVIYDSKDSANQGKKVAALDTTTAGEFEYDVLISSGLTYDNYGSAPASIDITYRKDDTYDVWVSSFINSAHTGNLISAGTGILHKVILSSGTAGGVGLVIYDTQAGTAQDDRIVEIDGGSAVNHTYDIFVSSGLKYVQTGSGGFTIIYKRTAP